MMYYARHKVQDTTALYTLCHILFFVSFIIITLLLQISLSACKKDSAQSDNFTPDGQRYNNLISDRWFGIYFKGNKLGFTNSMVYEGEDGYKIVSKAIIKMKVYGEVQETSFSQECYLTKDLKAKGFNSLHQIAVHRQSISGFVKGDKLYMKITSAGAVSKTTIDFDRDTYLSGAIDLIIKKNGISVGKKYNLKILMEPIQTILLIQIEIKRKEKVIIDGLEKEAFYLEERYKGLTAGMWVTEDGEILKEVSLEGLESRREDRDTALRFDKDVIPMSSLITFSLIKPDKTIKEPHQVKRLRLKLKNISKPDIIIEDRRQRVLSKNQVGKVYEVEMEVRLESQKSEARSKKLEGNISFDKYLEETPEIQSNNSEIKMKASEIVGGESDLWLKVLKINKWVFDYLEKKPVDTFSAVDALKSREGECQSHSNLFAALSRASGIPTKIVSGIVYSQDYNGFLYHAWPEVFIGEWIPLDPTLGEEEVDATHVKLVEGSWEEQLKLLYFIGKVGIEIIKIG
ncbi:MAG: transglutaminase-like domain-containing protein [Nitrospinota bacterium]